MTDITSNLLCYLKYKPTVDWDSTNITGTVASGSTATTINLSSAMSETNLYIFQIIKFTSGTHNGKYRIISNCPTNSSITINTLGSAPTLGDNYIIYYNLASVRDRASNLYFNTYQSMYGATGTGEAYYYSTAQLGSGVDVIKLVSASNYTGCIIAVQVSDTIYFRKITSMSLDNYYAYLEDAPSSFLNYTGSLTITNGDTFCIYSPVNVNNYYSQYKESSSVALRYIDTANMFNNSSFTISMFVCYNSLTIYSPFKIKWASNKGVTLYFNNGSTSKLYIFDKVITIPTGFTHSTWYYLAITYNGTTVNIYKTQVGSSLSATPVATDTTTNVSYDTGNKIFTGSDEADRLYISLDEFRYYDRVLTTDDLIAIYNLGVNPLNIPDNFTATAISSSAITLEWDEVEGATGYQIFRSLDELTGYSMIGVVGA